MKAMILAAGFGTRLLPATKSLPKPCFPILNKPVIAYIIDNLKAAGVNEIVINLHHLGDKIKSALKSCKFEGVKIHYSFEKDILGTAGGIKKVQKLLDGGTFILHNGDIFSAIDLKGALRFHKEKGSEATMVVKEGEHSSFIGLDDDFKITRFPYGALKPHVGYKRKTYFTGIHILEPIVFDYIPGEGFYCINSNVYPDIMADGHSAYGYVTDAYWQDIGTPKDYLSANSYMLGGKDFLAGEGTVIEDGCTIGPNTVLGKGCLIGKNCKITDSVIFDDVVIKESVVIEDSIILDGCVIQANKHIKGQAVSTLLY
jgi:NDP-sugar pyrophosphorylase family protein